MSIPRDWDELQPQCSLIKYGTLLYEGQYRSAVCSPFLEKCEIWTEMLSWMFLLYRLDESWTKLFIICCSCNLHCIWNTDKKKKMSGNQDVGKEKGSTVASLCLHLLLPEHDSVMFGCLLWQICLSSVTFVHSTQGLKLSAIFLCHFVPWPSSDLRAKLYGDVPREPLRRGH